MKNSFLIGKRIYLRGLNYEDINNSNYVQWLNDFDVCRYNRHSVFPYIKEGAAEYIGNIYKNRDQIVLAVVLKENDLHIGNITLQKINYINRSADFSILLGERSCWGKGYAKEASVLIIKHGFMELGLCRIYCGTSAENIAMQKLASYLGMTNEGCRRNAFYKRGKFVDWIEYGLLRDEFFSKFNICKQDS